MDQQSLLNTLQNSTQNTQDQMELQMQESMNQALEQIMPQLQLFMTFFLILSVISVLVIIIGTIYKVRVQRAILRMDKNIQLLVAQQSAPTPPTPTNSYPELTKQ
jgi:cytoskeletal protein RodZ